MLSSDIKQKYTIGRLLGSGTYGEVKLATKKDTNMHYAVKIVSIKSDKDEGVIKKEIEILTKLKHPNIIELVEVYHSKHLFSSKSKKIYIVMEYASGEELFKRIIEKKTFSEPEARTVFKQIMEALEYMHDHGVVHRDLKPENIMFANDEPDSPIKIADFGLAKCFNPDANESGLKTFCGTPGYVAPEMIKRAGKSPYTEVVDVWSAGVILYILLCGFPPFYAENRHDLFLQIARGTFSFPSPEWDLISPEAKDMVSQCLKSDPTERITPVGALAHEWMRISTNKMSSEISTNNLTKFSRKEKFKRVKNVLLAVGRLMKIFEQSLYKLEQANRLIET